VPEEHFAEEEDERAGEAHEVPGRRKQKQKNYADESEHRENPRVASEIPLGGIVTT
jgi:hypothetical protein